MKLHTDINTAYCFSGNCGKGGKLMDGTEVIEKENSQTKHEALKQTITLINNEVSLIPTKPIIHPENLTEIFTKLK